jgi:hypothetical protein
MAAMPSTRLSELGVGAVRGSWSQRGFKTAARQLAFWLWLKSVA